MSPHKLRIVSASVSLIFGLALAGCREPSGSAAPAASRPESTHAPSAIAERPSEAKPTPPEPQPTTRQTTVVSGNRLEVTVLDPRERQEGWLVIEEIEKAGAPAKAIGLIAQPRKLIVTTDNVKIINIILPKAGVPSNKSVVLRIDNQGIEITGRYGPVRRFERSVQGVWSAKPKGK
ncbi:MAG: hypothetical protein JXQ73_16825 [Phycisphaerae bacterium]|nr:hypothetical protein [Phycisphaerae bacterium]